MRVNRQRISGYVLVFLFATSTWFPCAWAQSLDTTLKPTDTPKLDARGQAEVDYNLRMHTEYRGRVERELAEAKLDEDITEMAVERLRRSGADVFQIQRVEITGWFSYAPDKVEQRYKDYFTQRIPLSNVAPPPARSGPVARAWGQLWNYAWNGLRDVLNETRYDRRGILSARAAEKLKDISNTSIREIWAHSWATDVIYNAILYGDVLPPKRLVLMGLPSRNLAKWESLARATGTEVFIFGFDQDFVSRSYSLEFPEVGVVRFSAGDFPGALTQDLETLASTWNAWVIENAVRKRPDAHPTEPSVLWKVPDGVMGNHLRENYYDYLIGTLSLFLPLYDLADQQNALIQKEKEILKEEYTVRLLKESPPPPFQYNGDFIARAQVHVEPARPFTGDSTSMPCLNATLEKFCESAGGLDRLPSVCGVGTTLLQASPSALKAAAGRYPANTCTSELADLMIRQRGFPTSHGFYPVDILNKHVQTIRSPQINSNKGGQNPSNTSPQANQTCKEECWNEPDCGPVTFVHKCVNGFCFDAPRQHCGSKKVCQHVCR